MGWSQWDWVHLNLHPQPCVMSPISIFVHSICVDHVLFLNKTAATRLCQRAWGRVSHAAHCPFWPGKLNFILYRLALVCLKAMSIPGFLPPISHQLFPCSEAVMMFNIWWCCPCVIGVRHHGLHVLYKRVGNCCLGFFSLDTQRQRVQDLDQGDYQLWVWEVSTVALFSLVLPHVGCCNLNNSC